MNVSVLVCTYGSREWEAAGDVAAELALAAVAQPLEIVRLHRPDATLSEVRNEAAQLATGDWLCFLDADDRLDYGYLAAMELAHAERLVGIADARTESGPRPTRTIPLVPPALLVPAVQYVGEQGTPTGPPAIPSWGRPLEEINCAVIGTLVPRWLFLSVGGFPEEPIYEDWACWLACVRAGAELVPVPAAVYVATVRPGSRNTPSSTATEVYWRRRREHELWLAETRP